MTALPTVNAVRGTWSKDGQTLHLTYRVIGSGDMHAAFFAETVAAIKAWLEQTKVPTPEERGQWIVDYLANVGIHRGELERAEAQQHIADAIAAAIAADRAARETTT